VIDVSSCPGGSLRSVAADWLLVSSAHEQCEACGFDGLTYGAPELLGALRGLGDRWRRQLQAAAADLRTRPQPHTWSAIEYAHSRDVTALHAHGVEQALTHDEPVYPLWVTM
jgi:hypothetical protein